MAASRYPLVICANRLPVRRVRRRGRAAWELSPGGLVSALTPFLQQREGAWVGWTGQPGKAPEPFEHDDIWNIPVGLNRQEVEEYYHGFANRTLWPLYHDAIRWPEYHREWWRAYEDVNRRFAEAAAEAAAEGAVVWIQDYHLQLVPAMLRELRGDLRIGFFLHIPFPPSELFAQLPWRRPILKGLLGCDVVGFQTRQAVQNFVRLARRFANAEGARGELEWRGRKVLARHNPISIDFELFEKRATDPATVKEALSLRHRLGLGRKIILGVDRLDYTKGIDLRLKAYHELLHERRLSERDTVFVQVAVPSRENVIFYRELRDRVDRLVGQINGEHASLGRVAVHYLHRGLPPEELVPLYCAADVMLVTPYRDGMNLVAKEYVACRERRDGVLVLSEFAGASQELRQALSVNPHDVEGLKDQMERALEMSAGEQRRRMRSLRRQVRRHDVHHWAEGFLEQLGL
jgi:trehalose 6-phosphate synthase